ncbi:MAG: DMT family transporter [Clostridia bacterium]|nr:DMT family transporter [Clostridia bacterium]
MSPIDNKKQNIFANPIVLTLVALLCCALWGSATPAIKTGYRLLEVEGVSSIMLFAGIRFFLAGIFTVIIFSIARKKLLIPKKENIGRILTVASVQTVIQYVFFYLGLAYTSGVKGTVASGSGAFFAVLIASLIFRQEKLTVKKIIACVVGFLGIVLINLNGLTLSSDPLDLMGVAFVLLSAIALSFSSVLIKKYSAYEDPVTISGYQFIVGGFFMILIGLIFGGTVDFSNVFGLLDLIYLALLSAVAYSLWGILLKHNPVSKITVFNFTTPVFGVLLTMLLLPGESSSVNPVNLIVTLILISTGILLLNYKKADK